MNLLESTCKIDRIFNVKGPDSKLSRLERTYKTLSKKSVKEVVLGGNTSEEKFLNKIADGIGQIGVGYDFTGEKEVGDDMVFEFTSSSAPTIRVSVNKEELKKYISKGNKNGTE